MIPANRRNRNQRRKQQNNGPNVCPQNVKYNQSPDIKNDQNKVVKKNTKTKDIINNDSKKENEQDQDPLNMKGRPLSDILKSQIKREIKSEMKTEVKNMIDENERNKHAQKEKNKKEEENIKVEDVKNKVATLKLYDNSKEEKGSMLVEWNIKELGKYDRIAIYQHQRLHDTHYLQIFNVKENTGKHIFKELVDGFYDVRLLNWNKRYENIPIVECCLGEKVDIKAEIPKNIYPPVLKVYIPGKSITSKNDYIAIYHKKEHSNKFSKSLIVRYMDKTKFVKKDETNENALKYVKINLRNIVGDYIIKYFHYNSTSMLYGNVYSGICEISIKNYNNLEVKVDKKNKSIKINWRIYTIEPNNSQWIGICDEKNKLRHYEYVCYHKYTNDSKMSGTVVIEKNKFIERFFGGSDEDVKDADKDEMEKTIEHEKEDSSKEKTWKVKFYDKGMFMSSKLMEVPLNRDK